MPLYESYKKLNWFKNIVKDKEYNEILNYLDNNDEERALTLISKIRIIQLVQKFNNGSRIDALRHLKTHCLDITSNIKGSFSYCLLFKI